MPSYQNVTPLISLSSGDVGFSFNNEAFPGSATSGASLPSPASAAAAAEEAFLAPDPGLARDGIRPQHVTKPRRLRAF